MCVCRIMLELIIDLNNTDPDGESLKTRPMKTAPLFCVVLSNRNLFPVQMQLVRLHVTNPPTHTPTQAHTHTHTLHLCRPSAVVETLWTVTSSFRDH